MNRQPTFAKPLGGGESLILVGSVFAIFGLGASIFFFSQTGEWLSLFPLLFTAIGLFIVWVGRRMNAKQRAPKEESEQGG